MKVHSYFDLNRDLKQIPDIAEGGAKYHWIPQWIALVLGIAMQPYFTSFRNTGVWRFDGLTGWFFFSLIVGLIIFPSIYRGAFDPSKPVIVQIGPIFAAGLGWESLFGTALEAGRAAITQGP